MPGAGRHARLLGRRVIVTRARSQAAALTDLLVAAGADVLECPTIKFVDPGDWGPADASIAALDTFDWIVFTSANAVERFFDRLAQRGLGAGAPSRASIAAVGPATEAALAAVGVAADVVAKDHVAEGLAAELIEREVSGARILIPRAERAREVLPQTLREAGAEVVVAAVYTTVPEERAPETVMRALQAGEVDAITFTSGSTVKQFAALFGGRAVTEVLSGIAVVTIGPVTSAAAREIGLEADAEAADATVAGLVDALAAAIGPSPEVAE